MFVFAAIFMALAGVLMLRVREPRVGTTPAEIPF
jgi:hypothetical protein